MLERCSPKVDRIPGPTQSTFSKQDQLPDLIIPNRYWTNMEDVNCSEQLNTTKCRPRVWKISKQHIMWHSWALKIRAGVTHMPSNVTQVRILNLQLYTCFTWPQLHDRKYWIHFKQKQPKAKVAKLFRFLFYVCRFGLEEPIMVWNSPHFNLQVEFHDSRSI